MSGSSCSEESGGEYLGLDVFKKSGKTIEIKMLRRIDNKKVFDYGGH